MALCGGRAAHDGRGNSHRPSSRQCRCGTALMAAWQPDSPRSLLVQAGNSQQQVSIQVASTKVVAEQCCKRVGNVGTLSSAAPVWAWRWWIGLGGGCTGAAGSTADKGRLGAT